MNHIDPSNALELSTAQFRRDGYVLIPKLFDHAICHKVNEFVDGALSPLQGPAEFEADVGYTGSPRNREEVGGSTPRRLLNAYSRHRLFQDLALDSGISRYLRAFLDAQQVFVSQCHHNCVMTKYPGYSSSTMWHQDIRYWSFDRPELISAWIGLGTETEKNGALQVIPGSHVLDLDRGRFDRDLFVRDDLKANQALLNQSICLRLEAGDVLFFHCRTIHAAGRNHTDKTKVSVVFTYHDGANQPIPGSRSAQYPSIELP